jgi:hypothetical protein
MISYFERAVIAAPQQTEKLVNDMAKARFLGIWRLNPSAPWPTDPTEAAQLNEMIFCRD